MNISNNCHLHRHTAMTMLIIAFTFSTGCGSQKSPQISTNPLGANTGASAKTSSEKVAGTPSIPSPAREQIIHSMKAQQASGAGSLKDNHQ